MDNLMRLIREPSPHVPGSGPADPPRPGHQPAGSVAPLAVPAMLSLLARLRLTAELLEDEPELATVLCSATSLMPIIEAVRTATRARLRCAGVSFVLVDGDQCFYPEHDSTAPVWPGQRMPISESLFGWALLPGRPAVIDDVEADHRVPPGVARPGSVRSLVAMPVPGPDQPIGVIGAYWLTTGQASRADLDWLRRVALAVAGAVGEIGLDRAPWAPSFSTGAPRRDAHRGERLRALAYLSSQDRLVRAHTQSCETAARCAATATAVAATLQAVAETRRVVASRMAGSDSWLACATSAAQLAQRERGRAGRLRQAAAKIAAAQPRRMRSPAAKAGRPPVVTDRPAATAS